MVPRNINTLSRNAYLILVEREKKCGTIGKHAKKPKNAKKAKTAETTSIRCTLAECEAGPYNQVKKDKDTRKSMEFKRYLYFRTEW